jgi:hypothetical protein
MNNWYHTLKGAYNIRENTIHLDFGSHIGDSKQAEGTLVHEAIHAALASTEFGQATRTAQQVIPRIKDLSEKEQLAMMRSLIESQDFVQEGFATLMQFLWLAEDMGKKSALDLAERVLPKEYLDKLKEFYFVFDLSKRYRDLFTATVSNLAMQTDIREIAQKADIFRSHESLKKYLSDEDNNPNERLKKLIVNIKIQTWLVTKTHNEVATASGITFHAPASKKDVAAFLTYMASRMGDGRIYTESEIGDTPRDEDFYPNVAEEVVIGNLSQKFSGQSEMIFKLGDLLHYSDVAETIFVSPYHDTKEERDRLASLTGSTPEIVLGMIANTGAKYLTATSHDIAEKILKYELKDATLLAKEGAFNPLTNEAFGSPALRHPDFVIYNKAKNLLAMLENFLKTNPEARLKYFYAAAMEGHMLRTLYVKIEDQIPTYVVNTLGGKSIDQIVELIKDRAIRITADELRKNKNHYNNLLVFWMGMHREIDWIEIMIDPKKEQLYFRDGRAIKVPKL